MYPLRIVKKLYQLGPKKTWELSVQKIRAKLFYRRWRYEALRQQAHHSWEHIARKNHTSASCSLFLKRLGCRVLELPHYLSLAMPLEDLCGLADAYVNNRFDILSSGVQQFEHLPWHEDIRLKKHYLTADHLFPNNLFYKDIAINVGEEEVIKDIKVPWELSRFQHLLILGQAYEKTHHGAYADTFTRHIDDWIQHNPFMLGPNWMCPMEVGLRALNWVIAFHYFKQESTIPECFWQRFTENLYDHFFYLENNWEVYDGRTSNHYLSDLVGYFYLCWFFQELPTIYNKRDWCFAEIVRECEKQIFFEGISYEGSTAYHRLVTELFLHAFLLAQEQQLCIPQSFKEKLSAMLHVIDWCTPHGGELITIGDHDSGCVTRAGITLSMRNVFQQKSTTGTTTFAEFGLSIIKTPTWHLSLRHHAYQAQQPSGHFHNDAGSITLALDGIPIIIDPGSYLYTPSRQWRNYFRSATVHNTLFVEGHEPTEFDERLFALELPLCQMPTRTERFAHKLYTTHHLYRRFGLTCNRSITLDHTQRVVHIVDSYECTQKHAPRFLNFNLTFGPTIQVIGTSEGFILSHNCVPIAHIQTGLVTYEPYTGYVSLAYGSITTTTALRARVPCCERGSYTMSIIKQ